MAVNFCNLILETFLVEIHLIIFCQYAKFCNAAFEKVYLDLLQSFFKIKLKAYSQLSKKSVDKFCAPSFCAILSRRKNVSNILCLIRKPKERKKENLDITHFFTTLRMKQVVSANESN